MATGNSLSISALRRQVWRMKLFADVRDDLYMQRFIGKDARSMVQELTDLKKGKGDTINFGLGMKLSGTGTEGDDELENNEETLTDYSESLAINQLRHGVRLTGEMDEQKNCYDMRMRAKTALQDWWAERIDQEIIDKICGKTTSTFSNTPSAAASSRAVYAGGQSAINGITTAMKMDTKVLDLAKQTAKLASPKIRPIRVDGKPHYVAILHPYDMTNLKQDPVYMQAQREANVRGNKNPIFSGAEGVWDGIILHEHEYVYRTNDGSGSAYVARNVLCGQQAGVIAWGKPVKWAEKTFDYGNKVGFKVGAIFGVIKPMFNSVDYGVVTMYAASAAASTA